MDTISLREVEVWFRIGVPEEERARAQRLLISIDMEVDVREAARADDLARTVNYFPIHQAIRRLGDNRQWKLIETLAEEIAGLVLQDPLVRKVRVEVRKFILPDTRHVSVCIERHRP